MKRDPAENSRLLTGLYFRLLPYQVLLIAINAVNGIVDSLYASNAIGKSAMSAIGLFAPMNHFLYAASILFVGGAQILYGRFLAQDRRKINGLFTLDLLVPGALSVLTSVALFVAVATGATRAFTGVEPDLKMLNDYILGQAAGIPALVVGQQLFAFLSMENQKRRTMVATVACLVVNAALDNVFIVAMSMGTLGLGLSTTISTWVFLGVQAAYYLRGKSEWRPSLHSIPWRELSGMLRLGYPGALSRFVEMFRCVIVNSLLMKYVGSIGLSSFAASNSLLAVIWSIPFGMVAVSRMLFSISAGEEDRRSLTDVLRIVLTWGMLLMGGIVALLVGFAEPLTRLFYRDPADPVFQLTVMGFRLLPLCMPLAVLSLNYTCYVQTVERRVMSIVLPVIDGMVGVVLFSLALIPAMKMNGLYVANILNGALCALVILIGAWLALKRLPRTLEDLMAIPPRIGVNADARIDISVQSMEQVVMVSRQVSEFCERRGIDRRRAFIAGLCLEEMAGNVVSHGFTKDDRPHSADIRVIQKEDGVIMRIRDNCRLFNPTDYSRIMDMDGDGKNVGIRLVNSIATDVRYQNLLGMNVLTMRI